MVMIINDDDDALRYKDRDTTGKHGTNNEM